MPEYSNGYIPESLLITFNVGYDGDGLWKHQLSAATYAKHLALVGRARQRTGRLLRLGTGWTAYRPIGPQETYRDRYGNGAAVPGTSSHGGIWEGRQTLAMDYGNWSYVYDGDVSAFYADCRAVGLAPGLISAARGYPDEPWHVIDLNPWAAVAGGSTTSEENEMSARAEEQIDALYKATFGPNNGETATTKPLGWTNIHGDVQTAEYGSLPIEIHSQTLIAQALGELAALRAAVTQLSAGSGVALDMAAIEAAAERGVKDALSRLVLTASAEE